jgi:hypothetical protein
MRDAQQAKTHLSTLLEQIERARNRHHQARPRHGALGAVGTVSRERLERTVAPEELSARPSPTLCGIPQGLLASGMLSEAVIKYMDKEKDHLSSLSMPPAPRLTGPREKRRLSTSTQP